MLVILWVAHLTLHKDLLLVPKRTVSRCHVFDYLVPGRWDSFGKFRRCDFVKGLCFWGQADFGVSKAQTILSVFVLLHPCGSRCNVLPTVAKT